MLRAGGGSNNKEQPWTWDTSAAHGEKRRSLKKGGVSQAVQSTQEGGRTPGTGPDPEKGMASAACGS